jgi:NAD(P)H-dependent FMN reductase
MSTKTPHVVGVVGSLRDASVTRTAIDHGIRAARQAGATTMMVDLREYEMPVYDADTDDAGDAEAIRAATREADSVILGTPVYHGSYSSPLKTYLDYCGFDEFEHTTVGLLAVSGGRFPVTALEHLRSVCRSLNAWVMPHQAALPRSSQVFFDGGFVDEDLEDRVYSLGHKCVQYASIEPDPDSFESCENVGATD